MRYTEKLMLNGEEFYFAAPGGGGGGRQPSANTLCYCPLEQDGTDATGNYTFTTLDIGDLSFSDNGYGLDVMSKSSTSNFEYTSCSDRAGTIGIRAKLNASPTWDDNGTIISQGESYNILYDNGWQGGTGVMVRIYDSNTEHRSAHYTTDLTDWHLYMFTYDGTDMNFYVDGQLFDTVNNISAPSISQINLLGINASLGRGVKGQFSKALWETPVWTAQEVSDYYDQTKSLYGIS